MAYKTSSSSSSLSLDSEVSTCSKECLKAYATLKEQYDSLTLDFKKSQHDLFSYKAGLQSVEETLVHYKKNKVVFTVKINVLNLEVELKDKVLVEYTTNLEKAEKEKDILKLTLVKLQNSSKSLNTLLEVSDKSKADLGYKELIPKSFVSSSELLEKQDNRSDKGYHEIVDANHKGMFSKEEPKPVKKNSFSPPIIEYWVSESEEEDKPKFQKQVQLSFPKIKFVKAKDQNHSFKKPVKQIQVSNGLGLEKSLTPHLKIGTSSRRSLGEEDASKEDRNLKQWKQRSIFKERDFDVQYMMDANYELAARLRGEEQRRKLLTKS
uniref:Uncharacterized protein n=1 Tax=Tanacetum cinerariifolium TaxID=118510 RepID=A0A6L2LNG7_TANCI|nr:hypothetical protein [Tanacetum cinerariifolium]